MNARYSLSECVALYLFHRQSKGVRVLLKEARGNQSKECHFKM